MTDALKCPDYRLWALEMCALLDRIEAVADDEEAVMVLTQGRFKIAERHGFTVVFDGRTTGGLQ